MRVITHFLAVVLLLLGDVHAQNDPDVACQTDMGTAAVAVVPTTTSTVTDSVRPTQFVPYARTTTVVKNIASTRVAMFTVRTTTTAKPLVGTFMTTSTLFAFTTSTSTSSTTETTTTTDFTTSTSTTVVATATGWQAIGRTVNTVSMSNMKARLFKFMVHGPRAVSENGGLAAAQYPQAVNCVKVLPNLNTRTVVTVQPMSTSTRTVITRVLTSTSTVRLTSTIFPPNNFVVMTTSSTSTITSSTTVTSTATEFPGVLATVVASGPTLYPACDDTNNYFGPGFSSLDSKNVKQPYFAVNLVNNGPGVSSNFDVLADGADTARDCCIACQAFDGGCETFAFRTSGRSCFLMYHSGAAGSATCKQSSHPNYFLSRSGTDTGAGYIVGNGPCGFTYSGNSDSSLFKVAQ